MTISATNQGLRPGVCTSTSRPSTPFTGQLIFETDTNRLAVWNGSSWVFLADADTPSGLQLIKAQTITSGGATAITGVFSSEFDSYRIIFSDARVTSGAANIKVTLGSASTGYYWAGQYLSYAASPTETSEGASNGASWATGIIPSTTSAGGVVEIYNPFLSQRTSYYAIGTDARTTGAPRLQYSGFLDNATSYTDFTVTPDSQTWANVVVRVYGYRNS